MSGAPAGWTSSLRGGSEPVTSALARNKSLDKSRGEQLDAALTADCRTRGTPVTKVPLRSRPAAPMAPANGKATKTPARAPKLNLPQGSSTPGEAEDLSPRAGSVMSLCDTGSVLDDDDSNRGGESVQVFVRVRPPNSAELDTSGSTTCLEIVGTRSIKLMRPGHGPATYRFDHVLGPAAPQLEVFEVAGEPIVDNCLAGYNSSIFAYGQTGSGKTHTMLGNLTGDLGVSEQTGLAPRVFDYLYAQIAKEEMEQENLRITCRCSFLEIYNEVISDLLNPKASSLQIEPDGHGGCQAKGAVEEAAVNAGEVLALMRRGAEQRRTAETRMNATSSRSHSVFTCTVERSYKAHENGVTNVIFSRLNLVDLAGSERNSSGAMGGSQAAGQHLVEANYINKSLLTLGRIIGMLATAQQNGTKPGHIPHRDSRLTYLLRDSLGGNAKTTIIANVSPSTACSAETRSTLEFVKQAKHIRTRAKVNVDCRGDVSALRDEIQRLNTELVNLRAGFTDPAIQENAELRKRMEELQAEIDKLMRDADEKLTEFRHLKRERDRLEERLTRSQAANGKQEDSAGRLMQKCDLMEAALEAANSNYVQMTAVEREINQRELSALLQQCELHRTDAAAAHSACATLSAQLSDASQQLLSEQARSAAAAGRADSTAGQLAASTVQLDAARAQLLASQASLSSSEAQALSLRSEIEMLRRERAAALESASLSAGSLAECRTQLQLLQQAHCETSQARGGLSAQVSLLSEQLLQATTLHEAERAAHRATEGVRAALEASLASAHQELGATAAGLGAQLVAEKEAHQQVDSALVSLQQQYADIQAHLVAKEADCHQLSTGLEAMSADVERLQRQLDETEATVAAHEQSSAELRQQLSQAQAAVREGSDLAATLQQRLDESQAMVVEGSDRKAALEAQVAEAVAMTQTRADEAAGLCTRLQESEHAVEAGERAVQALQGELSQSCQAVADAEARFAALQLQLEQDSEKGSAALEALQQQLESLQGSSSEQVQQLSTQLEGEQEARAATGDLLRGAREEVAAVQAALEAELVGRAAAENAVVDLRMQLVDMQTELASAQEQVASLVVASELATAEAEMEREAAAAVALRLQQEVATSASRSDELQQAHDAAAAMIEEQAGAIAQLKQDIEFATASSAAAIAMLEAVVSDLTGTSEDLRQEKAALLACIENQQLELATGASQLAAAANDAAELQGRLARTETELGETSRSLTAAKADAERLRTGLAEEEKAHNRSRAVLEGMQSELDGLRVDAAEASVACSKQEKDARDLRKDLIRLEEALVGKEFERKSQVTSLSSSLETVRKELVVLQTRLDERCSELATVKQRLMEEQSRAVAAGSRLAERDQELSHVRKAAAEAAVEAKQRLRQEQDSSSQQAQDLVAVRSRLLDIESQLKGYLLANTRQTKAFSEIRRLIEWATTPPSSTRSSVAQSEAATPASPDRSALIALAMERASFHRSASGASQQRRSIVAHAAAELLSATSPVPSPKGHLRMRYGPISPADSPRSNGVAGSPIAARRLAAQAWSSPEEMDARPRADQSVALDPLAER